MDENEDFESQQSSPAVVGAPGRLTEEQLSRNMMALHDGINDLGTQYDKHVFLAFEDPVTFGAGHYVFYPLEGHASRFAVTDRTRVLTGETTKGFRRPGRGNRKSMCRVRMVRIRG